MVTVVNCSDTPQPNQSRSLFTVLSAATKIGQRNWMKTNDEGWRKGRRRRGEEGTEINYPYVLIYYYEAEEKKKQPILVFFL